MTKTMSALAAALGLLSTAPADAASPIDVGALVAECAPCHGADGIAPDSEVPHLAGQNLLYLQNQLRAFHEGRRKHQEMRYMTRSLTEAEIEALAAYYADLPALTGSIALEGRRRPVAAGPRRVARRRRPA